MSGTQDGRRSLTAHCGQCVLGGCSAFILKYPPRGPGQPWLALAGLPSCLEMVAGKGPLSNRRGQKPSVPGSAWDSGDFWTIASFTCSGAVPSIPLAAVGDGQGRRRPFFKAGWSREWPVDQPRALNRTPVPVDPWLSPWPPVL